jgi:hypothetical protein
VAVAVFVVLVLAELVLRARAMADGTARAILTVIASVVAVLLMMAAWAVEGGYRNSRRCLALETPAVEAAEGLCVKAPAGMVLVSWEEGVEEEEEEEEGKEDAAQPVVPCPR